MEWIKRVRAAVGWKAQTTVGPHPPVGTPGALLRGGNSTPARALVAGVGNGE